MESVDLWQAYSLCEAEDRQTLRQRSKEREREREGEGGRGGGREEERCTLVRLQTSFVIDGRCPPPDTHV